jgi:phosphoribosyl 1,2-cyclic phosphodiesterase
MNLKVLATGSSGNCYILENDDTALIIEAGVTLKKVKEALNFNTSKVVGCLISHSHGDHSKYAISYMDNGINCFMSSHTAEEIDTKGDMPAHLPYFDKLLKYGGFKIGDFLVVPFELEHDVKCFGFQIDHADIGRLVFITDTDYSPYAFNNVNHWMVECNYSDKIIDAKLMYGNINPHLHRRVKNSHMSLETAIELFKANNLNVTRNIVLIHGSEGNSDPEEFKAEVMGATGKPVYVAEKGMEVNL